MRHAGADWRHKRNEWQGGRTDRSCVLRISSPRPLQYISVRRTGHRLNRCRITSASSVISRAMSPGRRKRKTAGLTGRLTGVCQVLLELILCRLCAGGNCVVTANDGALQGIGGIFRRLPCLAVPQVLRHVIEVVSFACQRPFKDALSACARRGIMSADDRNGHRLAVLDKSDRRRA
jgi:hypothetical protein